MIERAFTYAGGILLALIFATYIQHTVTQMHDAIQARWAATVGAVVRR